MAGTIDIGTVKVDTKSAKKDVEALNAKLDESAKKVEEVSNSGGRLQDLKDGFGALKVGVAGGVAAYAALITATTSYAIVAERNAVAIRGLGAGFNAIRAATNDAVSAQSAFAAQNQITQSGLRISGDQLAIVARAAREFALRTGTDSAQAMQQLSAAIVSGDAQALRPFGVSVMQGTLRTQALRQALTQLSSQQQGSIAPARTLAEETERLSRSWDVFRDSMAASAANALDLKTAISDMGTVLEDFARGGNLAANALNALTQEWLGVNAVATRGNAQGAGLAARQEAGNFLSVLQTSSHRVNLEGFNYNQLNDADAVAFNQEIRSNPNSQAVIDRYRDRLSQSLGARRQAVAAGARGAARPGAGGTSDRAERLRTMSAIDRAALAEDQRAARQTLATTISDMQQQGYRFAPGWRANMERLINGFLDPANKQRFEQRLASLGRTTTNESRLRGLDMDSRRMGLVEYQEGGAGRAEFDTSREYLSGMTVDGRDSVGSRFGFGLTNSQYGEILASEREKSGSVSEMGASVNAFGRRNDMGELLTAAKTGQNAFFSDTQTLAEKGAKGVESAFNTMTGAVSGFVDALIEGQVPAGEAAVGMAKAVLKGLAMQAIPEGLMETAKGIAALANPALAHSAPTHFAAAGVYFGVAALAGAGAAGIGAAQRGAASSGASSASASASQYTPLGGSSGGQQQGGGTVIFNINSTVFDPERAEETVARLQRGANARGL